MHETGVIRKLVQTALEEAESRGGRLMRIYIRLGALAGGTAAHLREHFVHEIRALGLDDIDLVIEEAPDHPAGVEITGIDIGRKRTDPGAAAPAPGEDAGAKV